MRFNILCGLSALVPMILLCFLLEPLTGEPAAALLSVGLTIACLLYWIEQCRTWQKFETDRLIEVAQMMYPAVFYLLVPSIANLLVNVEATAPAWQRMIAYPVVWIVVVALVTLIAPLLCRFSFSAAEIRDANRRRAEAFRRPSSADPESTS